MSKSNQLAISMYKLQAVVNDPHISKKFRESALKELLQIEKQISSEGTSDNVRNKDNTHNTRSKV